MIDLPLPAGVERQMIQTSARPRGDVDYTISWMAELSGLAQLHAKGGAMALWPLVKTLLAEDDTIMREFWHAKLATMNLRWVTGAAQPQHGTAWVAGSRPGRFLGCHRHCHRHRHCHCHRRARR